MSEPQVDPTVDVSSPSFLLDGDAPRLGSTAPTWATPDVRAASATPSPTTPTMTPPAGPTLHAPSPVLGATASTPLLGSADRRPHPAPLEDRATASEAPTNIVPTLPTDSGPAPAPAPGSPTGAPSNAAPTMPSTTPLVPPTPSLPATPIGGAATPTFADDAPSLPATTPVARPTPTTDTTAGTTANDSPPSGATAVGDGHPMAHLMTPQAAPGEASRRAAEIRAAKKARARKVKIGVAVGALVVAALAGPPLVGWVSDAVADAGSTDVEE